MVTSVGTTSTFNLQGSKQKKGQKFIATLLFLIFLICAIYLFITNDPFNLKDRYPDTVFTAAGSCIFTRAAGNNNWSDAGNWDCGHVPTSSDDVTINVPYQIYLDSPTNIASLTLGNSAGTTTARLRITYDAIADGPLVISDGDLIIHQGADIFHAETDKVNVQVTNGDAVISGAITADGVGNAGGYYFTSTINHIDGYGPGGGEGAGVNTNQRGAGGSYGGLGGVWGSQNPGPIYGDPDQPTDYGSGGGAGGISGSNNAGSGGGAIKLEVSGNITITGRISANGRGSADGQSNYPDAAGGGAGSGGSIWIIGNNVNGTGNITANGGTSAVIQPGRYKGGAGGGGRVSIQHHGTYGVTGTVTANAGATISGNIIIGNDPNPSMPAANGTLRITQLEPADTPIPTPTNTLVPTNTLLPTATNTVVPTPTNTPIFTMTPTSTLVPSNTPTTIPTLTNTPTLTPTLTPSFTPTPTFTPSPTPTLTSTPTPTPTNTPTGTLVPTDTPTNTPTASNTPTGTIQPTSSIIIPTDPVVSPTSGSNLPVTSLSKNSEQKLVLGFILVSIGITIVLVDLNYGIPNVLKKNNSIKKKKKFTINYD